MAFSEEQLESLARKIEERERRSRRTAWLVTVIPIIFAGLLLAYTVWQISIKQNELNQIEKDTSALRTQVPQAQNTLAAAVATQAVVETAKAQVQTELSQAHIELSTAQVALTQADVAIAQKVDAGRLLAQGQCKIDEVVLKDYASYESPQVQILLFLLSTQQKNIPWNINGFSETEGFNSPNFAIYVLQNAIHGYPLISTDYKAGALPWNILQPTTSPENGDIAYYQGGYTMFYFELPATYGGQQMNKCAIGMTPLGIISLPIDFAYRIGFLKVPYP